MQTGADDATASAVAAALLYALNRRLNSWSMLLALAAILVVVLKPMAVSAVGAFIASLLAAGFQSYYSVRVAFDAALFARLGGERERYAQLDRILERMNLKKTDVPERDITERTAGALALVRHQGYCVLAQSILVGVGIFIVLRG